MKKEKKTHVQAPAEPLYIPEDEIWTYRIDGLQEPRIGMAHTHSAAKKAAVVVSLLIAIGLSIFFSVQAIRNDTFEYKQLENGWQLTKYSNPGEVTELSIDCVDGDPEKPITSLREYFLNCDEKLLTVHIGASVTDIDSKSFYSCWHLQAITVDESNPNYCDIDGVLYTKDKREVICYPIDRDQYLRDKFGYAEELWPDSEGYSEDYVRDVQTYRLPAETKIIGKLAFNYSNLAVIYLPEGLETIESMAFFRNESLRNIYTGTGDTVYPSLPDSVTYIGSDAFSYDQALTYMFIPKSVTYIGHHAFWGTVYKAGGNLAGVTELNVEADEQSFRQNTEIGDQWTPKYDYMLFSKSVPIIYGAERTETK